MCAPTSWPTQTGGPATKLAARVEQTALVAACGPEACGLTLGISTHWSDWAGVS